MRAQTGVKSKGTRKANPQQVTYELKHRVVLALNKVADRDTCQIGVEELEKTAESLKPDGIVPFLSCILDTDSEQKSAVRKECIRMMGLLAKVHDSFISPHVGRMVAAIVKRLKDQDSVVRDMCVETIGVLASIFGNSEMDSDGLFVALVRPFFEVLGEQNKQIQFGAALCLARVIDNINDPPISVLQRMLARTIKLLKNPHFMAKPAVIELNRSLIQAGGAPSRNALSAAISSIQEALKNSDWTTRKAASLALGEICSSGRSLLVPFKASCINVLESCRFDKVKPVRDAVLQALHCWKTLPGPDATDTLDTGSSIKENSCVEDCSDLVSAGSSMSKDVTYSDSKDDSIKKRAISVRKASTICTENSNQLLNNNWDIEVVVPKKHNVLSGYPQNEELEGSYATKTLETVTNDFVNMRDVGQDYGFMEDKQEFSSASNHVSGNFPCKRTIASHCLSHEASEVKLVGTDQNFVEEENSQKALTYVTKMQDRASLDSVITDSEDSQAVHVGYLHTKNEIVSIRKQLFDIEKKQSSLMDVLQVFTASTMESLSAIQSKVFGLENAVEKIAHGLVHGGKYADIVNAKHVKKCQSMASPRLSTTCTPRSSIDIHDRHSSAQTPETAKFWDEKMLGNSINCMAETRRRPVSKMNRSFIREPTVKRTTTYNFNGKTDRVVAPTSYITSRQISQVHENELWKRVKGFMCEGDVDSAYKEILCSDNDLVLVELLDRTGPVLESLSNRTASDLLSTLVAYLREQRFVTSIIPWFQQVVELSDIHGPNYIPISMKAKREVLSAVHEILNADLSHPSERRIFAQLAMKLEQFWGKLPTNVS